MTLRAKNLNVARLHSLTLHDFQSFLASLFAYLANAEAEKAQILLAGPLLCVKELSGALGLFVPIDRRRQGAYVHAH